MLVEQQFGSLGRRHLTVRWVVPMTFTVWTGKHRRRTGPYLMRWRRLLDPRRWKRTIFARWQWGWYIGRRWRGANHRCYCPVGSAQHGRILLAGWGVCWWYSRFTGDTPCPCDEAMDALAAEDAD